MTVCHGLTVPGHRCDSDGVNHDAYNCYCDQQCMLQPSSSRSIASLYLDGTGVTLMELSRGVCTAQHA
jgi:hypothetical protein